MVPRVSIPAPPRPHAASLKASKLGLSSGWQRAPPTGSGHTHLLQEASGIPGHPHLVLILLPSGCALSAYQGVAGPQPPDPLLAHTGGSAASLRAHQGARPPRPCSPRVPAPRGSIRQAASRGPPCAGGTHRLVSGGAWPGHFLKAMPVESRGQEGGSTERCWKGLSPSQPLEPALPQTELTSYGQRHRDPKRATTARVHTPSWHGGPKSRPEDKR